MKLSEDRHKRHIIHWRTRRLQCRLLSTESSTTVVDVKHTLLQLFYVASNEHVAAQSYSDYGQSCCGHKDTRPANTGISRVSGVTVFRAQSAGVVLHQVRKPCTKGSTQKFFPCISDIIGVYYMNLDISHLSPLGNLHNMQIKTTTVEKCFRHQKLKRIFTDPRTRFLRNRNFTAGLARSDAETRTRRHWRYFSWLTSTSVRAACLYNIV